MTECITRVNIKIRRSMEEASTFTMMAELKTVIGRMANSLKHEIYSNVQNIIEMIKSIFKFV